MAIEEPSVVAAASLAAKLARAGGGFKAGADAAVMIGQVQLCGFAGAEAAERARAAILERKAEVLAAADELHPSMRARGGGAVDLEVRTLGLPGETQLVVHLLVDTQDAMGANLINTVCEGTAPLLASLSGGRVRLRILSNLADRRLARASCRIPVETLADFGLTGAEVAQGIAEASRFADADAYRACTHNKGFMNGVDAVALATGNDWRAIEAGAHAWAARAGRYAPLSRWWIDDGHLRGEAELPLQLGTVGGALKANPLLPAVMRVLGDPPARKLCGIIAAVGLAQNLAALRALGTVGIQKGHMALHARNLAVSAGARGPAVDQVAHALVASGEIKLHRAREILDRVQREAIPA
jgi:hydroxymethylglutaryl-CoA reductase